MEKVKKTLPILAAPDIGQMTPFKPTFNWIPGQHRIPGGVFPMPPVAAEVCTKLPPPDCFNGPYVILDQLLRTMSNINLNPAILLGNDVTGNEIFKMLIQITIYQHSGLFLRGSVDDPNHYFNLQAYLSGFPSIHQVKSCTAGEA